MTLDLDGVRALVRRLDAERTWRHGVCEPYAEHAQRVEARVAAAGGDVELRMVALLHRARRLTRAPRRSLLKAGVPGRVLDLVDVLAYDMSIPVGEHADRIREAGLEPVCRADVEDQSAGSLIQFVKLLVELDVTDPSRRPDPGDLLAKLSGPMDTFDWWYSVVAVGRLRIVEAVPQLTVMFGRLAEQDPVPYGEWAIRSALVHIVTGTGENYSYGGPAEAAFTPVLLQLGEHPARRVREVALRLLEKVDADPAYVDLLRRALSSERFELAATAAQVLGRHRVREAVDDLIGVLGAQSGLEPWLAARLRCSAAAALGHIGDPAAIDALVAALDDDPVFEVPTYAASALGQIGTEQAIEALLRHGGIEALLALGQLRVREAVPGLVHWLRQTPSSRVVLCIEALARIGASEAIGVLTSLAATSFDAPERTAAVRAISQIDPDAGIDALLLAANDPDSRVRRQAVVGLCRSRDPRAVVGMRAILAVGPGQHLVLRALADRPDPTAATAVFDVLRRTRDERDRRLAAQALLAIAPLTDGLVNRLKTDLRTANDHVRQQIVWLLGELGERQSAPSLAQQLDHRTETVRTAAAAALATLGPPDPALTPSDAESVNRRLAAAASDPSPRVRAKAVLALGSRERAEDMPLVVAALDDPHPGVRAAAATALRRSERAHLGTL